MSTRLIHCAKLKKEAPGLTKPPYPGTLGKKIFEEISQEAWQLWLGRQTMFINEYHLNLTETEARNFLKVEMEKFLFSDEDNKPAGYQPETID